MGQPPSTHWEKRRERERGEFPLKPGLEKTREEAGGNAPSRGALYNENGGRSNQMKKEGILWSQGHVLFTLKGVINTPWAIFSQILYYFLF